MQQKNKKSRFDVIRKKLEKLPGYMVLGIAVLLTFSLFGSISKIREVNTKIEKESQILEELKKDNEALQKEVQKTQTEEFIEKQLRDKLGMAREGEIVVVLPDAETVKKFAPLLEKDEDLPPDPNWKKWLKLFF